MPGKFSLGQLFLNSFDPVRVKYQHYSTKVIGHRIVSMPSYGISATATTGGGINRSKTLGHSHTVGNQWSHTDTAGTAEKRRAKIPVRA